MPDRPDTSGSDTRDAGTDAAQANANRAHARALIQSLVDSGVRFVVCCPGSRSTALAMAAFEHPDLDLTVHWDERGASFFALGIARATGIPAVWITTSGTAVANGMPAAVEADADDVPLLLLTADRPPELRQTGANQTIHQPGFFDRVARWSMDLPAPHADGDPRSWATSGAQAVYRAQHPHAGPVHLNAPFRKPLWPSPDAQAAGSTPTTPRHAFAQAAAPVDEVARALLGIECGIVVAGRLAPGDLAGPAGPARSAQAEDVSPACDAAYRLGERLNWPVLADVGSQGRLGDGRALHHDLALASSDFADTHQPDAILLVGGMPVSGRVLRFLESAQPRVWARINSGPDRIDPYHRATHVLVGDIAATLDALAGAVPQRDAGDWLAGWRDASDAAWHVVHPLLDTLTEPGLAHRLTQLLPKDDPLVIAASMPIRNVDTFAPTDGPRVRVFANRGASGIDGTVATAAGIAHATGRGTTVLIGDLALLHDLNSLAMLRDLPERLVVVLVNNDGGGIFGQLPIAAFGADEHADPFERLFGTPHGMKFSGAARQFGLNYSAPESLSGFADAYRGALARETSTLIEVRIPRTDGTRHTALEGIRRSEQSRAGERR